MEACSQDVVCLQMRAQYSPLEQTLRNDQSDRWYVAWVVVSVWFGAGLVLAWGTFRALEEWTRIGCWPEPGGFVAVSCLLLWSVLLCVACYASCARNGWLTLCHWRVKWWLVWVPFVPLLVLSIVELPVAGVLLCASGGQHQIIQRSCARCVDGCTDTTLLDYARLAIVGCPTDFLALVPELGPTVLNCESGTLVTGAQPGALSASIFSIRAAVLWDVGNDTSKVTKHGSVPQVVRNDVVSKPRYDTNLLIATGSASDFRRAHDDSAHWETHLNYDMNTEQWILPEDRKEMKRAYMRSVENLRGHWRDFFQVSMRETFERLALLNAKSELYESLIRSTMNITCRMHLANSDDGCDEDTLDLFYNWARTTGSRSVYTLQVAEAVMDKIEQQYDALVADPDAPRFENTFMRQWLVVLPEQGSSFNFTPKQARLEVMHNILAMGAQLSNLVAQTVRAHTCASEAAADCAGIPHGFMASTDAQFVPHTHFVELMRWISPGLPFTIGSAMAKMFDFPAENDVWDPASGARKPLCGMKVSTMSAPARWVSGASRHTSIGAALRVANRALVSRGNQFEAERYARHGGLLADEYDVLPNSGQLVGPRGEVPDTNTTTVSHRRGWAPFGTGYRRCPGESYIRDALEGLHALLSSGRYTFELDDARVESNRFAFLGLAPKDNLMGSVRTN